MADLDKEQAVGTGDEESFPAPDPCSVGHFPCCKARGAFPRGEDVGSGLLKRHTIWEIDTRSALPHFSRERALQTFNN